MGDRTDRTLEVSGAPRNQGIAQGFALRAEVRAALAADAARGAVDRAAARALRRFLPQHHERLAGLALASGVSLRALERAELASEVLVGAAPRASGLECALEPGVLEPFLLLRASVPDVGGFASAELTTALWAGCLAGVNSEGLAVACNARGQLAGAALRWLAQDVLFRTRTLESALEHLRRRAPYVRATGALVLADADGHATALELRSGALLAAALEPLPFQRALPALTLDTSRRSVLFHTAKGGEVKLDLRSMS